MNLQNNDGFYLFPRGQPVAVDSKFYWYEFNYQCLAAFDVVTNEWSLAYVPIHDSHECLLDGEIDSPLRLAPLADNDFCFWDPPASITNLAPLLTASHLTFTA